jgi:hypothetical protein
MLPPSEVKPNTHLNCILHILTEHVRIYSTILESILFPPKVESNMH